VIKAKIEIDGVVDQPDVVGAVFGQTEGLLGEDLDLRELQRTGRIGRIQIVIKTEGGHSKGEIVIPVSLNKTATAILAASLETVDRVGPCTAKVTLLKLEDIRGAKRRKVVSRAISILKGWEEDISPGTDEITTAVSKASKKSIAKFGPDKLPAGPELANSSEIIIVEGRADVLTLMKNGIHNTVAVEGTHIPRSIITLTKKRGTTVVAFLDGDRGGDLILRELMQVAKVDYIARAPKGKEVEELTRRQITKALQTRIPADKALALVSGRRKTPVSKTKRQTRKTTRTKREEISSSDLEAELPRKHTTRRTKPTPKAPLAVDDVYLSKIDEIKESFNAILLDDDKKVIVKCGVAELAKTLESHPKVPTILFDGVVTQRLVDIASKKKTTLIIGAAVADIENRPRNMQIVTFDDLAN
jgi:DNA primase